MLRAARAGDAKFVELLLKRGALVDLPSKEGVTPLMAAAGVEFGTRVTRGRNRTNEGVLATMRLLLDAGADINARMVTEPRRVAVDGASARAAAAAGRGARGSQMPSPFAVPHETALHGAALTRPHHAVTSQSERLAIMICLLEVAGGSRYGRAVAAGRAALVRG